MITCCCIAPTGGRCFYTSPGFNGLKPGRVFCMLPDQQPMGGLHVNEFWAHRLSYYREHSVHRANSEHRTAASRSSPSALDCVGHRTAWMCNMTFEETGGENSVERMESVAQALEEVLSSALPQGCITVGVYEAAKSLNVDPDNVVLCLLATDDEEDVALQIHFTLIQAFCCENDINILRVGNMRRLAEILGGVKPGGEPMDVHCVLVTNPQSALWKNPALSKVNRFCRDCRCLDQWVPVINLPDR
ncbi:PREDICTED: growth arrest and DNA damage-inducible protein GADD45 alpha-like [Poecilia mexicana]|nr:PREDICTED: growth arrest and DNA damage-inducible protein GADD45 alpha-like [Poecilia mexicana]